MAGGVVSQRHPRPSASAGGVWSRLPSPSLALLRVMAVVRPASLIPHPFPQAQQCGHARE